MREAGFNDISETAFSQLNPSEKKAFAHISHELPYYNPKTNSKVELHWKLVAPKSLFPKTESEIWSNKQLIQFGGIEIHALSKENQLLYLCVHGAKHQWFRLFWLRDVWQIIKQREFDLDALIANLETNGNHRSLLSGLALCQEFFDYELSEKMKELAKTDSTFNEVLRRCKQSIIAPEATSMPSNEENIWGITKNLMQLKTGWRYKLECLHRFRTSPQDWERLKLPKKWFFLYYFARPFMMLQRRINQC